MADGTRLDLEKTYAAILAAAREHRFISYGDIAGASAVPWPRARRLGPNHLGRLVTLAHERGWPMPSAIIVSKENLETGVLDGAARNGFLAAAREVGLEITDAESFVREQQRKIFEGVKKPHLSIWASTRTTPLPRRFPPMSFLMIPSGNSGSSAQPGAERMTSSMNSLTKTSGRMGTRISSPNMCRGCNLGIGSR